MTHGHVFIQAKYPAVCFVITFMLSKRLLNPLYPLGYSEARGGGGWGGVTPLYLPEELKRRLCNFPAPLSDCRVFRLCEIMPAVSHALQSRNFSKCRPAWILTLCPRNHNATAHLRSHSCFFDRLVILNEDRIL